MSVMRHFPINLDIRDKPVTVIGGGLVAARKCSALLEAGARVTVVSPELAPALSAMRDRGEISHRERGFIPGDCNGAFLVFAATDSHEANQAVAEEARSFAILADIADDPDLGSFTLPAVMRRGDLQIAVSTGGKSPALARLIREQLEELYGPEYGRTLELLGRLREKLLTEKGNSAYNKQIFNALAERLPALVKCASADEIDDLLRTMCGPGVTLAGLGLTGKDPE